MLGMSGRDPRSVDGIRLDLHGESARGESADSRFSPFAWSTLTCLSLLRPPQAGHVNKRADELCTECRIAQPSNLSDPTVTCPSCQSVTAVPSSNARKHAREAATKTKEFAVQTAVATKAGVEHLRAAPTTFHCQSRRCARPAHCAQLSPVADCMPLF
jgi:hypothetical protein